MIKTLFFDVETTGTKFWKNGIHQIAGIIDIDGTEVDRFKYNVNPEPVEIDPKALEVSNVKESDIRSYPAKGFVYHQLLKHLQANVDKYNKKDKYFLCGFNNAPFDNNFFRSFFLQNGDEYFGSWFWSNTFDVMVLATPYLMHERTEMPDFKLHTVAKQLGFEVDDTKLHDAMYDMELTRKMFYKIVGNG